MGDSYYRLTGQNWKWLGDFVLLGYPLNIIISVKSFHAKERLLVSGTGSTLTPTIEFGLFKKPSEFKSSRLHSYILRGFSAIYIPQTTLGEVEQDSKELQNLNGKVFLRPLEDFGNDLRDSLKEIKVGDRQTKMVDHTLV